jgi:hypothetical protein
MHIVEQVSIIFSKPPDRKSVHGLREDSRVRKMVEN